MLRDDHRRGQRCSHLFITLPLEGSGLTERSQRPKETSACIHYERVAPHIERPLSRANSHALAVAWLKVKRGDRSQACRRSDKVGADVT
jgi:hypothetical protein